MPRTWKGWTAWSIAQAVLTLIFHVLVRPAYKLAEDALLGWTNDQIAQFFGLEAPTVKVVLALILTWGIPFLAAAVVLVLYHLIHTHFLLRSSEPTQPESRLRIDWRPTLLPTKIPEEDFLYILPIVPVEHVREESHLLQVIAQPGQNLTWPSHGPAFRVEISNAGSEPVFNLNISAQIRLTRMGPTTSEVTDHQPNQIVCSGETPIKIDGLNGQKPFVFYTYNIGQYAADLIFSDTAAGTTLSGSAIELRLTKSKHHNDLTIPPAPYPTSAANSFGPFPPSEIQDMQNKIARYRSTPLPTQAGEKQAYRVEMEIRPTEAAIENLNTLDDKNRPQKIVTSLHKLRSVIDSMGFHVANYHGVGKAPHEIRTLVELNQAKNELSSHLPWMKLRGTEQAERAIHGILLDLSNIGHSKAWFRKTLDSFDRKQQIITRELKKHYGGKEGFAP